MNVTDVNAILVLALVLIGSMALAAWLSPQSLDWLVVRLVARSLALVASRAAYRAAHAAAMSEQAGAMGREI